MDCLEEVGKGQRHHHHEHGDHHDKFDEGESARASLSAPWRENQTTILELRGQLGVDGTIPLICLLTSRPGGIRAFWRYLKPLSHRRFSRLRNSRFARASLGIWGNLFIFSGRLRREFRPEK